MIPRIIKAQQVLQSPTAASIVGSLRRPANAEFVTMTAKPIVFVTMAGTAILRKQDSIYHVEGVADLGSNMLSYYYSTSYS